MNKMMEKILVKEGEEKQYFKVDFFVNEIVNKTKIIGDCLVYDYDGSLREEKINFNRIFRLVGDKTGYEVNCNEFRVSKQTIHVSQYLELAQKLSEMLAQKFAKRKIVVYISVEENLEIRFHTYREEEANWLVDDLNKYDIPILFWQT